MDRDTEQLNLLAIFHYVVAGLAALFSFFPLIYTIGRRHLRRGCAERNGKTGRGIAA
jgi:hypothetical protein